MLQSNSTMVRKHVHTDVSHAAKWAFPRWGSSVDALTYELSRFPWSFDVSLYEAFVSDIGSGNNMGYNSLTAETVSTTHKIHKRARKKGSLDRFKDLILLVNTGVSIRKELKKNIENNPFRICKAMLFLGLYMNKILWKQCVRPIKIEHSKVIKYGNKTSNVEFGTIRLALP